MRNLYRRLITILALLAVFAVPLPAPTYNLTATQLEIIVTWLYEPHGYLDYACRISDSQCARQAWQADNQLDVLQWIRDNPQQNPANSNQVAMVWWIWKNDQVNITPPGRPPEAASWATILHAWDASINAGFDRASQADRNAKSKATYDASSCPSDWSKTQSSSLCTATGSIPAGSHLAQQQQMISAVLGVLE